MEIYYNNETPQKCYNKRINRNIDQTFMFTFNSIYNNNLDHSGVVCNLTDPAKVVWLYSCVIFFTSFRV